ncbi:YD repeat-containing protein [Pelomonas saccharophila]|uniref:YD repeat-containing protein n=1 Tax=Roseateles saccharophilus TaxID=304 RepID=A0ABU1YI91_ROSSA|nr:hypothetical protein [Roseateles saccharophilus]MDR7268564.1 YD repeat-containing protein [Roseateles saccharophilus]
MVSVVTGSGAGLVNTSKDVLGAAGGLGQASTGRAGEQVTVNAANGNLVVQDRDEFLAGVGPDANLLRTYNSQGGWDGDNGDRWRIGYYRKVYGLGGGMIKRVEADGRLTTYTLEGGQYVSKDGSGQYDTLSYDAPSDTWTWRDGDTGTTETYQLYGAGNYRLTRVTDPEGHYVAIDYSGDQISRISTYKAGGATAIGVIKLTYGGTKLQSTEYWESGAKARSLTRYDYDSSDRLWHVTTDLSPDDSAVADGKVYTITYGYEGAAVDARLNSIQQTDGTQITISYESGTGRVASVLDGRGLGTTFTYDAPGTTTVKDALGQATTLKYSPKGELLEILGAVTGGSSFTQKYTYDPTTGDLLTSTNAKNETTTYEYNSVGAMTRRTDAAGNVLERGYTSGNLLATETLYLVPDPDGPTNAGTASKPLTTNYYYDTTSGRRRLMYVIYGDGSLTSYVYDGLGQLTDTFKYSPDVVFSGNRQTWSEVSAFATNAFKTDKGIQRLHHEYDLRGLLSKERSYASSTYNATTNGFDSVDATDTIYTYDPSGRLLSRLDASGVKLAYEYDGLGRITKSLDTNLVATVYSYDDVGRKTSVQLANGQTTVQTFNQWGDLVASDVLGAGNTQANPKALGATQYSYDNLGRLWRTTDATGVAVFSLYDVSGRKSADIAANGQLTEYLYDAAGRLIQRIAYATLLSQTTLSGLTAASTVASVRPAMQVDQDRITTSYYDMAGRLTGVLDADGYLSVTKYDGASAVTSQTTYANAVAVTRLDVSKGTTQSSAPSQPAPTVDAARDRTLRNLYDGAGRLAAQIDGDGGLTRWTYDATGNRRSQLRRSTLLDDSLRTTGDLATLSNLALLADDEFTQWLYDGHGVQIAQLSAEGYFTEFTYDGAGRLKDTLQYLTRAFRPIVTGSPNTLRWLQRAELDTLRPTLGAALKTSRSYNNRGLLESETSVDSTVTFYQYDDLQRLKTKTLAYGSSEAVGRYVDYDDWGRVQIAKTLGDAAEAVTWYDAAGRRVRIKDARGNTTFYYYDAQGRQVYAILRDPLVGGEVTETIYSNFSEVQATVTHRERLSLNDVAGLTGGQAATARLSRAPAGDISLAEAIAALSKTSFDNRSSAIYNRRGLIQQAIDALGDKTDYSYNAFSQLRQESRDIDPVGTANARRLTLDYGYDRRGHATRTERSGPGLTSAVITGATFDALGRLYDTTDELSRVTQYTYTRDSGSGRKVTIAGPAGTTSTTYDALDRMVARVDRTISTVTYTHDAINRKLTVKTAAGIQIVTEYNRNGQVYKVTDGAGATTTYAYDAHGNLLTVTDALGNVTQNGYDANDNLVQVVQGLKANASGAPINDGSATTTSYSFDAANRVLTQTVDPLVNGVGLNLQTRYEYDGQGRKLKITDSRGTVTTQVFNAKGELADVIVDDVAGGLKLKTSYSYDAQSRVLTVVEGAGTAASRKTAYAYDILGRRTSEIVDPEGLKLKISYEYDAAGRLAIEGTLNTTSEAIAAAWRGDWALARAHWKYEPSPEARAAIYERINPAPDPRFARIDAVRNSGLAGIVSLVGDATGASSTTLDRLAQGGELVEGSFGQLGGFQLPRYARSNTYASRANRRPKTNPAREEWLTSNSRLRAEQTVAGVDLPLESPSPIASRIGHGHGDHGHQTSFSEQATRVRTGISPTGRSAPTSKASKFVSPEAEAEAIGRGTEELMRALGRGVVPPGVIDGRGMPTFVEPNGLPVRYSVIVSTNQPGGFGKSVVKLKNAATGAVFYDGFGLPVTQISPTVLMSAKIIWEYVPSIGGWRQVTYYPE